MHLFRCRLGVYSAIDKAISYCLAESLHDMAMQHILTYFVYLSHSARKQDLKMQSFFNVYNILSSPWLAAMHTAFIRIMKIRFHQIH